MTDVLTLGISPCPNDTYIFDAWVNGKLQDRAPPVRCRLEDIATLNRMALQGALDIVKVSFFTYGLVRDSYSLVHAGGALGRGCGPLIVARSGNINRGALAGSGVRIGVPGRWTTANLLLCLYQPEACNKTFMRFETIMPAVARGDIDAGVIIHEGRFTYENYGLSMVEDLGAWWEKTTGCPIPLGAIIARGSLGDHTVAAVESAIRSSLAYARSHPGSAQAFMQLHAKEMQPEVMCRHVDLYVNDYTMAYGPDGLQAIRRLLGCAERNRLFAPAD